MHDRILEVKSALVQTFGGEQLEVHGGAYLSPEAYLTANAELQRLREKDLHQDVKANQVTALVVGASLVGLAIGYWLGARGDDDEA